jgi:Sel1 repeat
MCASLRAGDAIMRWLKLLIASVGIAASGTALALPNPEAEAAYERGDYRTAFTLWLPLAEQGSPRAQMNIARMYEKGEFVAQDSATAMEWYRKAAEQSVRDSENAPAANTAQASTQAVSTVSPSRGGAPAQVQPTYVQPTYAQPVYVPVFVQRRPPPPGAPFVHWHRR